MKNIIFIALTLIGFSISSIANNIDNDELIQRKVIKSNGIETVITQQQYTASTIEEKTNSTLKMLEVAFNTKATICSNNNNCYFDFESSKGDTARLLVDKTKNTLMLITKKSI